MRIRLGEYHWDKNKKGEEVLIINQTLMAKLLGKPIVIFRKWL